MGMGTGAVDEDKDDDDDLMAISPPKRTPVRGGAASRSRIRGGIVLGWTWRVVLIGLVEKDISMVGIKGEDEEE
ncbi:hypothetical protein V5O48_010779 [Marasmius crinis-equi]|uniref:Uncharacterized protein n=1 Tax=Marasmius crinis-equi TaxID=585013 RepID=A0ABR3F7V3_9AGAR